MRKFFLLLAFCLFAKPSYAAITYVAGGDTNGIIAFATAGSGSATLVATLPASSNLGVGDLAEVLIPVRNASTPTGCVDSKSNTYTADYALVSNTPSFLRSFRSVLTSALAPGDTITCTLNASTTNKSVIVLGFTGNDPTPLDGTPTTNTGTGTTFSAGPTATLACPGGGANCEALVAVSTYANGGTITPDAGWTSVGTFTGVVAHVQYKIVSATTAQSWSISNSGSSGAWIAAITAFKAASSSSAQGGQRQPLLGVSN